MKRLFLLIFLVSCTLHPRYQRPEMEMPQSWRTPVYCQKEIEQKWWQAFGDPVLDSLVERALFQNQDLQVAISRIDQYEAQLGIVRANLFPQLSVEGIGTRQKISSAVTALPGNQDIFNVFGFIFKPSYWVDLWGEVRSAVESARADYLAAIDAERWVKLQLISSVINTYIQLRQSDSQLAISQRTLYDRQIALEQAQIRFELGRTSQLPVEQAITEVDQAEIQVENFARIIAEGENLLSLLLGEMSQAIPRGRALDELYLPPSIPSYAPAEIVCQRPDIREQEFKLMAANADIGVARAKFLPKIMAIGSWGSEGNSIPSLFTTSATIWSIGASAVQEIFTGGRLINNVRLSFAKKEEALHQYLSKLLNGVKEVNDALISHKIFLEEVNTQRERVEALKSYLYLAHLRYEEGQTDYLTFLDAERHLFQGLLDLEQAVGNTFFSFVQIYLSLGGDWFCDYTQATIK